MAGDPNEGTPINAKPRSPSRRRIDPTRAAILVGVIVLVVGVVLATALTKNNASKPKAPLPEAENIPADPSQVGKLGLPPDYATIATTPPPPPPPAAPPAPVTGGRPANAIGQLGNQGRSQQEVDKERADNAALTSSILGDDEKQTAAPARATTANVGAIGSPDIPDVSTALQNLGRAAGGLGGSQGRNDDPAAIGEHYATQKIKFAEDASAPVQAKNTARLAKADSPYTIRSGWNIPLVLTTKVDTDGPAEIHAQVIHPVMDSKTGRFLLIPSGSDLKGKINSVVSPGQVCFQLIWQLLTLPNNATIDLAGTQGTDSEGTSCIKGEVDNHYADLATGIGLSSIVTILGSIAQNAGGASSGGQLSLGNTAASGVAQESAQVANQFVARELAIPPTIRKKAGERIYAVVSKALVLQPYVEE